MAYESIHFGLSDIPLRGLAVKTVAETMGVSFFHLNHRLCEGSRSGGGISTFVKYRGVGDPPQIDG